MVERHETYYSKEKALTCLAQHPGAEVIAHEGHRTLLNGVWTYVIPEDRPSWTVCWEDSGINRYFYTFGSDCGFPYSNGWVEVWAASAEEADRKFRARFADRPGHESTMNCSFRYNEKEWAEMDPEHSWPGWRLYKIIE